MIRQPILKELLFVSIFIAVLHHVAIVFSWYWVFWWMDILMHFLGGVAIGLAILWLVFVSGSVSIISMPHERLLGLCIVIGCVLVVGLGWEIFEFYAKVPNEKNILADTTIDFIMDALGGLVAYLYVVHRKILGNHGWD
jgi:hypothetical protein